MSDEADRIFGPPPLFCRTDIPVCHFCLNSSCYTRTGRNACPTQKGPKMGHYYQNEKEIEAVVQGFESCTTSADDFKHRNHLTVAVWYLRNSTPEQAFQKMCSGLLRF